jgi:hypothetical protein
MCIRDREVLHELITYRNALESLKFPLFHILINNIANQFYLIYSILKFKIIMYYIIYIIFLRFIVQLTLQSLLNGGGACLLADQGDTSTCLHL